jgi:integrase
MVGDPEASKDVELPSGMSSAGQNRSWTGPRDLRENILFLTVRGGDPTRSSFSRRVLREGDRRITWLPLRHTAASLMFDAGLTIFDVQRRLGHRSPVLTQEIYTHLMRERSDERRGNNGGVHRARHGTCTGA